MKGFGIKSKLAEVFDKLLNLSYLSPRRELSIMDIPNYIIKAQLLDS